MITNVFRIVCAEWCVQSAHDVKCSSNIHKYQVGIYAEWNGCNHLQARLCLDCCHFGPEVSGEYRKNYIDDHTEHFESHVEYVTMPCHAMPSHHHSKQMHVHKQ